MYSTIWIFLVMGGILLLAGVLGNSLVIIYFGVKVKCKKNYQLFLLILGVADFFSALSNFMFEWPNYIPFNTWRFGSIGCKYVWPVGISINTAACYVLVAMYYVRYRSIANPMQSHTTKLKIVIISLVIFAGSVLAHVPLMLCMSYQYGYCSFDFNVVFHGRRNYEIYRLFAIFVGRFLLPLTTMSYFLYKIKKCLEKSAVQFNNEIVNKRNKRVMKTLLWLVVIFSVSVGLCQILTLFQAIVVFTEWKEGAWWEIEWYIYLFHCFSAFYYLNNAVNCIIYAGDMPKFRKFLTRCCSVRNSVQINSSKINAPSTKTT